MSTIGYGDIYATNNNERIFIIFMSIFACGFFGYVISQISSILREEFIKDE